MSGSSTQGTRSALGWLIVLTAIVLAGLSTARWDRDAQWELGLTTASSVHQPVILTPASQGLFGTRIDDVAISPDGKHIVAMGAREVFRSSDGGEHWSPLTVDGWRPRSDLFHATFDDEGTLLVVSTLSFLRSSDGGESFEKQAGADSVVGIGRDEKGVYITVLDEESYRAETFRWPAGGTIERAPRPMPAERKRTKIEVQVGDEKRVLEARVSESEAVSFAATSAGLFRREGAQGTWTPVDMNTSAVSFATLEIDPARSFALAVDDASRLWTSHDLRSWTLADLGPMQTGAIAHDGFAAGGAGGCTRVWREGKAPIEACPPAALAFEHYPYGLSILKGDPDEAAEKLASWHSCALTFVEEGVLVAVAQVCPYEGGRNASSLEEVRYEPAALLLLDDNGVFSPAPWSRLAEVTEDVKKRAARADPAAALDEACAKELLLGPRTLTREPGPADGSDEGDFSGTGLRMRGLALGPRTVAYVGEEGVQVVELDDKCNARVPSVTWQWGYEDRAGRRYGIQRTAEAAVWRDDEGVHVLLPAGSGPWRADVTKPPPMNGRWLLHRLVFGPAFYVLWAVGLVLVLVRRRRLRGASSSS